RCAVTSSSSHDPPALPSFPTRRSSDLPKPTVSFLPETVNDPISDNARLTFPCTAQPPFSSNSLNRSSFAHTSEDLALTELFLTRSEEHTSELQSRENLVCRLLLEKKKE